VTFNHGVEGSSPSALTIEKTTLFPLSSSRITPSFRLWVTNGVTKAANNNRPSGEARPPPPLASPLDASRACLQHGNPSATL
jgi:hypothetical protein